MVEPIMAASNFDWSIVREYLFSQALLDGAKITLALTALAQGSGILLGVIAALAKTSRILPFRIVAEFYIWLFRGTPVFVQLILWFAGLPQIIPALTDVPPFWIAVIALGLNEGAYMAEIVRAGLQAVDVGQTEAAQSLGMRYGQIMRRIILPQAARVIVPPTGNELISMLKTTSLASYISVQELTQRSENIFGCTDCNGAAHNLELLSIASVYYLIMTTVISIIQAYIESRLGDRRGRESTGIAGLIDRAVTFAGAGIRR
jgi:polar amino acid transport system permease protein